MKALLAIDASTESALALDTAASLAWPDGSELTILTVLPTEVELLGGPWGIGVASPPTEDVQARLRAERLTILDQASRRAWATGLTVTPRLEEGRAATVIIERARRTGAELIILGARGHATFERALLGSVSAEVVDQAACPVLVARRPHAGRILLATDGSDVAMSAVQFIGAEGLFAGAVTRVVHAVDLHPAWWLGFAPGDGMYAADTYANVMAESHRQGDTSNTQAVTVLRSNGFDPSAVVREGQAASVIVDEARVWKADLVVVGTRGNGLLKRLVLGSTARTVLQHADPSVMVVGDRAAVVHRAERGSAAPVDAVPA